MTVRCTILSVALMGLIGATVPSVAHAQYPDWSGQWTDRDVSRWDPSRPTNLGQKAPLIPEYQAILDAAMADRAKGGTWQYANDQLRSHGYATRHACL